MADLSDTTHQPLFADKPKAPSAPEPFAGSKNIQVLPSHEPFHQHNDMFSRGFWDPRFRTPITMKFFKSFVKPTTRVRDEPGFSQQDFALRNGPWAVTEMLAEMHKDRDQRDGFTDPFTPHLPPKVDPADVGDERTAARHVKKVAKLYGADLVGITKYDPRWTYRSKFSARTVTSQPVDIPPEVTNVVVLGKSMDYDLVRMSPTATAATSAAAGYAEDAVTLLALAQYIRSMGYIAIANQNDTNLAIPYAILAGLGEYGRNGLCITREFGPRVRFGRILTNMPMAHDRPTSFGVEKTCEICRRCANNCPPQAIDHGKPSDHQFNKSNSCGIKKWTTDGEKCFKFWVLKGSDCANCIRTCPYNKDHTRLWSKLMMALLQTPLRKVALWLDDKSRLHDQIKPSSWWRSENGKYEMLERAKDHGVVPKLRDHQEKLKTLRDAKNAPGTDV